MERFDVAVIGGGLLGCFAARELSRWKLDIVLLEAREDVCTGISRANTAVVYPGYDHKPGTLKAEMCVRANASFDSLCRELDVPFSRCGSLMLSFGPAADAVLQKKLRQG
ncbi:MAG: FAD-dependent oxidoreductase, partial [Oscillospiraceae bacterium]|nr:FAD-dependent oxidoreductase [Oscillospiraceae bacterium]